MTRLMRLSARLGLIVLLLAPAARALRIGVAPLAGSGLTMDEARVARSLLVHDLQREMPQDLVVELRPEAWMALSPVLELLAEARAAGMERVVLISADHLGEKLILQLRLLDVATEQNLFTDALKAYSVENLDTAMNRAAMALARQKPVDEVREVGQVLEEEGISDRHRQAIQQTTLTAGYLWPISRNGLPDGAKASYDNEPRRFAMALSSGIEDRGFDAGWSLAWRHGPALLLYSDWLLRPRDVCPFIGGALGFHWVQHREDGDTKLDDGFHTNARAGLILFRTYDFQMVIQGDYIVTWNDRPDRAWMIGLGVRP
jgi:hypothetical protein